ncbi:SpoIIE family protein phosphatase, partial [Mycolicibacterium sp.]|uniref:PP2C family protein-serine/threonine phosphatase n=1 Tax=Mycolicibacterium sp. TaxID=2320850 RepID=UPI0028A59CA5
GVMALTWRDVTERVEQAQRITASENRLSRELSGAARYVASIMPGPLDGLVEVTSRHLAADELSGDSFGYRWVDDDHLMFYVVDVSGHGMAPAMVSVSVHNLLRSATFDREKLLEPAAVLTELNRLFQMEGHGGNYFTIWYGVYQASTRLLRFASAGHPPAIVLSPNVSPTQLATKSLPVGLLDTTEFATAEYEVPPQAYIVVYSDGAFDIAWPNGAPWSQPEFVDMCHRTAQSADWTLDSLLDGVNAVSGGEPFGDDCTLVRLSFP